MRTGGAEEINICFLATVYTAGLQLDGSDFSLELHAAPTAPSSVKCKFVDYWPLDG